MDKNIKNKKIIVILMVLVAVFSLSYYMGVEKMKINKKTDSNKIQVSNLDKFASNKDNDKDLSKDADVIFKIKYNKSKDIVVEKVKKASEINLKTKKQLEDKFEKQGYVIDEFTSNKVTLIKRVDKYTPNKYVLGIKGEFLAVFKTDKEGNMYIENQKTDITNTNIADLKAQDINLLTRGDKYFQRNTKEEALTCLEDYR